LFIAAGDIIVCERFCESPPGGGGGIFLRPTELDDPGGGGGGFLNPVDDVEALVVARDSPVEPLAPLLVLFCLFAKRIADYYRQQNLK
jgi:hypothetical protein